jgi:hypothetical protein
MRKDLCPIGLINLQNQMDEFLSHDWPYQQARERARQKRKERLINLAWFAFLFVAVVLVGVIVAMEKAGM